MQRSTDTEPTVPTPVEPTVRSSGPTPIDPADFKFIAGGAPGNRWDTSSTTLPSTSFAPKNGW